jgi:uncharacterized damage-inducible protein DinB
MDQDLGAVFIDFSQNKLKQFASRIKDCLDKLSYEQIWARGAENENAVGNLVLHLCGNVRQWIGSGVGGRPDVRVRDREFAAREGIQPSELSQSLEETVNDAVRVIRQLPQKRLSERVTIQSYDLTVLEAIYHVVEHFAQHTGQIIFATKQLRGQDLGFYKHLNKPTANSEGVP